MAIPTLSTQLDVVNTMLSTIGQSAITQSSLDSPPTQDIVMALAILDEINKEVQMMGWNFNAEFNYPLVPDPITQNITVPTDFIRLELTNVGIAGCLDIVQRGPLLYNRTSMNNIFPNTIYVNAIRYLDFNNLPEPAKRFIGMKACRVFQNRTLGGDTLAKYEVDDERRAWSVLLQYEMDTADYSLITDWPSIRARTRSFYT